MAFSISSTREGNHGAYALEDDTSGARAVVVPERGGIVTRWRVGDRPLLYLDSDRFADPSKSIRGGIPILFPICGNVEDDQYQWNGKTYPLKQHGFARDMAWDVGDQSTDNGAAITLKLASNETTRKVYPFDFDVEFTYRLLGRSLHIEQQYHNRSDEPMPFSTGLHTYFAVREKNDLKLDIPSAAYTKKGASEHYPFDGTLDYGQDEIDIAFDQLQRTDAVIDDVGTRSRIKTDFDDAYSTLVFWTIKGKDYYCLEPWSAGRNAMNTKKNLTILEPQATQTFRITLSFSHPGGMG
ncbi:MAG: aldose epimerase [Cyanophyceae cyanobacterium]